MDIERIEVPGFIGYAKSEIGGRHENQDSYGWTQTPVGLVLTVCDGMGGGPAGRTASMIAVEEILAYMRQNAPETDTPEGLAQLVKHAIEEANRKVYVKACSNAMLHGMGSTCTVLLLTKHHAIAAHVGDSRIYQIRGRKKKFRTFDHSLVFGLVKQKIITEEQARQSAQSNVITRALGLDESVEIDISTLDYKRGDRFMLTTDGIHGMMPEKELLAHAAERKTDSCNTVNRLVEKVEKIGQEKGGHHDNMTIMLIEACAQPGSDTGLGHRIRAFFDNLF